MRARAALAHAFRWVGVINVLLAGLNAIPGYPLDGGRVLQAVVWAISRNKTLGTRVAGWAGMAVGVGFAAFGVSQLSNSTTQFRAIWFFYLAFILISTARGTETRLKLRAELAKGHARDAMRPPPDVVPADMSLADVLRDYLRGREHETFPVVENGTVIGTISKDSARRVGARNPMRPAATASCPWRSPARCRPTTASTTYSTCWAATRGWSSRAAGWSAPSRRPTSSGGTRGTSAATIPRRPCPSRPAPTCRDAGVGAGG